MDSTNRKAPRRVVATLVVTLMAGMGCADDSTPSDTEAEQECACSAGTCTESTVCPVEIAWPTACTSAGALELTVSDETLVISDESATACAPLPAGGSVTIEASDATRARTGDSWPAQVEATCSASGQPARIPICSLRFDVAESCAGRIESWTVSINGEQVGEALFGAPLEPCTFVVPGAEPEFSARGGGSLIPAAPVGVCTETGGVIVATIGCP